MTANATPRPALPPRRPIASLVSAAVAVVISIGLMGSVAALFQCDGKPVEKFFVAQHSCADRAQAALGDECPR